MSSSFGFPGGGFDVMFSIFPFIFMAAFLVILGVIIVAAAKGIGQWRRNNASPVLDVAAIVVAKRADVSHRRHSGDSFHHSSTTYYYVTFEFDSGSRLELAVDGNQYGQMIEGDAGTLRFQGTRFLAFNRLAQPKDL